MAWNKVFKLKTTFVILMIACCDKTSGSKCQQGVTCFLPNCFCLNNTNAPGNLSRSEMPQLVVFAFDGSVNIDVFGYFHHFFDAERINSNGCSIRATLFVQNRYTNFTMVKDLYRRGFEIAGHSASGNPMYSYWKNATGKEMEYEIIENRKELSEKCAIPISEIRGWRTPHLLPVGNDQFRILSKQGFEYDSSLYFIRRKTTDPLTTPGTLEYAWPFPCQRNRCPTRNYTLWEVPVVSCFDLKLQYPCIQVDGCINIPQTENEAFQLIWNNFYDYYRWKKLPFVLNLKAGWLNTEFQYRALDRFMYSLLQLDDVYIVTMHELVQWMKHPLDVGQMMLTDCPEIITSGVGNTFQTSAILVLKMCIIMCVYLFNQ